MAGAISSFQSAVSSFSKNPAPYATYSFVMFVLSSIASGLLAAFIAVMSILLAGAGGSVIFIAAIAAVALIGTIIFIIAISGLYGAYIHILNALFCNRAHNLKLFFLLIPKYALSLTALSIVVSVVSLAPVAVFAYLAFLFQANLLLVVIFALLAALYLLAASIAFTFAIPASVVDSKNLQGSVRASLRLVPHNLLQIFVYWIISCLLAIPIVIPILGWLYAFLVYMPVTTLALLILYRGAS